MEELRQATSRSQPQESFEKLTGSLGWHWFPQAKGGSYESSQQLRAGHTFGQVPFDEIFILGLEPDNDLPLRTHIGARGSPKGSAPLGRNYFLENWELDKNVYDNGLMKLQLGPFFDLGRSPIRVRRWARTSGSSTPAP